LETRANHFLVGCFVLTLMAGIFFAGIWFARANLGEESTYYYAYFTGSVTGLSVGSTVRYRGVPVGTVSDIALDAGNVELVQVTLALRPDTPIKTDTFAGLQPQGITGLAFVQLSGGTQNAPPLLPREGKRRAVIQSQPSVLEKIMADAPLAVARIAELAERIAVLLNAENLQNVDRLIDSSADAATSFASAMLGVETFVYDANATLKRVDRLLLAMDAAAGDTRGLIAESRTAMREIGTAVREVAGVGPQASGALDELKRTAGSFGRVADALEQTMQAARPGVQDFGQHGVYELQQFMTEGRALMATLNRVIATFERDPARFLFGDQQKGVEAR
jgi:phospholipid/cholesterol/gamma-HCH transport system substrate-binding protein